MTNSKGCVYIYMYICAIIINNAGMFELPCSLNREVGEFFFFLSFFLQFSECTCMSPFFFFVDQGFRNAWEFKHRSTMQDSEQVPSGLDQRVSGAGLSITMPQFTPLRLWQKQEAGDITYYCNFSL